MQANIAKRLFNRSDYYKMAEIGILQPDARVELINGEIIDVSPINSFHAATVNVLNRLLLTSLGTSASISVQNPLFLNDYSEPEPDLVVAHYRRDEYRRAHPRVQDIFLLIEVADSSLDFDKGIKKQLYAKAGVPEYWVINLPEQQIEVYKQPEGEDYSFQKVFQGDNPISAQFISFALSPSDLFFEE